MTPIIYPYDGEDAAADWQPTNEPPPVTYEQWCAQRAAAGQEWRPYPTYQREANWTTTEWTGATCPYCGGGLELRRGDWLLCLPCREIWHGYDELDATRREVTARNEVTEE